MRNKITSFVLVICGFVVVSHSIEENSGESLQSTFHHRLHIGEIFVFDDVIPRTFGKAMVSYLTQNGFSYMYPDPYENHFKQTEGDLFWKSPVSPSLLIKSRIWPFIRKIYRSLPSGIRKGEKFLPYLVYGTMLHRGEGPVAFRGTTEEDATTEGKIFMRIFLSEKRDKNMYSDQAFYDENDEIVTSVHPKPYRAVVWTGDIQTLFHPPSIGFVEQEYSLVIKLTSDRKQYETGVAQYLKLEEEAKLHRNQPFPYANRADEFDASKLNVSKHLLGKYHDRHGNVIAFFDNVLPKHIVDAVRSYYVKYEGALQANLFSLASSETNDNVEFIYQFDSDDVLETPYLKVVQKLCEYLSNSTGWHPYDVSCNLIQHLHHTRIHIDCTHNEHEYTFLMYLNPNWTENMYAETTFYDEVPAVEDKEYVIKYGTEEYNFITAAIPKFGRIALFRNIIPHSARPPAPNFLAARYTFPIKVSESYRQARVKMVHELLDFKSLLKDKRNEPLYDILESGDYEPFLQDDKRDWVEKQRATLMKAMKDGRREGKRRLFKILFPEKYRPDVK